MTTPTTAPITMRPSPRTTRTTFPDRPAAGPTTTMTDADLARRAAALAAPKGSRPAKRRRHPAGTSRIVVAGLSATALFSLIATLTLSAPPQVAAVTQPVAVTTPPPPPKQVVVIIHRPVFVPVAVGPTTRSGSAGGQGTSRSAGATSSAPAATASAAAAPAPVRAAAAPVARPAPVTTTKTS